MNNEEQAIWALLSAARSLRRAAALLEGLLENIDSFAMKVEDGFERPRFVPRLLLVASEMVNQGAISAMVGTDLVQGNERLWRDIQAKQFSAQQKD